MIRRAGLGALVALSVLSASAVSTASAAIDPALLNAARLQGYWTMSGVVTKSVNVPGELPGELVTRSWAFVPPCPAGPCPTLQLLRQRAAGYDTLQLRLIAPGVYRGPGSFDAPARCRGTVFRKGERVPYTITVTVTGVAQQPDGSVLVTAVTATYRNLKRVGLTRCYSAPSYDSARYSGAPAAAPAAGAIRTERRMRSSTGS